MKIIFGGLVCLIAIVSAINISKNVSSDHLPTERCTRQLLEIAAPFIIMGRVAEAVYPIPVKHPYPHWTEAPAAGTTPSPMATSQDPVLASSTKKLLCSPSRGEGTSRTPRSPTSTTPKRPTSTSTKRPTSTTSMPPSTTTPIPTTEEPQAGPSRTQAPCPPRRQPANRMLINFELRDFRLIPRSLFMFVVEPLPRPLATSPDYDAEYMLINPDYLAALSPDRWRHSPATSSYTHTYRVPIANRHVTDVNFWGLTTLIETRVQQLREVTQNIHERVAAANKRLKEMQRWRFTKRLEILENAMWWQRAGYRMPPKGWKFEMNPYQDERDHELNNAFYFEVDNIARLMDQRSFYALDALVNVRRRDCILYGQALKKHGKDHGVPALPRFEINYDDRYYDNLFLHVNNEEQEWLLNPTLSWFPRQSYFRTTFEGNASPTHSPDDQTHQHLDHYQGSPEIKQSPFQIPNYPGVIIWPGPPVRLRRQLTNDQVHIYDSLHPDARSARRQSSSSSDSNDSDTRSGADFSISGGSDDQLTDMPPVEDGSGNGSTNDDINPDNNQQTFHNSTESTPNEQPDNDNDNDNDDDQNDNCYNEYTVTFKKARLQKRSDARIDTMVCTFRGGKKFAEFMNYLQKMSNKFIPFW